MRVEFKSKLRFVTCMWLAFILTISSCTSERKHDILSFFFDGVPENDSTATFTSSQLDSEGDMVVNRNSSNKEFFSHKPYEEEKCSSCHEPGFSNRLLYKMPELCYTCHNNFNTEFKHLHGPVSSGNCLECHNQHMSKYDKLLDNTGQDICLKCHQKDQILNSNKHKTLGTRNCTECHNPHGGDNSGMLMKGVCNECHKSFKDDYKYLHGPAGTESCTTCHASHSTANKFKLESIGQKLCYNCHSEEQVLAAPVHKKIAKTNCTECHNPHGENNKYFLRSNNELKTIKSDNNTINNKNIKNINNRNKSK